MTEATETTLNQIQEAYRDMAQAQYRPAAPGVEGVGGYRFDIYAPVEPLSEKECRRYAEIWREEEDNCDFSMGSCGDLPRKAMIFAVEAARNMCARRKGDKRVLALLKMAVAEMERVVEIEEKEAASCQSN